MKPIEQAIELIIGREPKPDEVTKFYKLKEVCGFSEHDAVWSILVAFGHYELLYKEYPDLIRKATTELLGEHKIAIEATAAAAEKMVKANLIESVSKTAREMASKAVEAESLLTRRRLALGIAIGLVCAAITVLGVSWFAYHVGIRAATADEAWLQTKEGAASKRFAELNNVGAMLDCPSTFSTRVEAEATYCVPYDSEHKKTWGWRIK